MVKCRVGKVESSWSEEIKTTFEDINFECEYDGEEGDVHVALAYSDDPESGRRCHFMYIHSYPERKGLGSAALPLVFKRFVDLKCDSISGGSLEESEGFWRKMGLDPDPFGQVRIPIQRHRRRP